MTIKQATTRIQSIQTSLCRLFCIINVWFKVVVDLSKKFNSSYIVEDRNIVNVNSMETLKVTDPMLLMVKDGVCTKVAIGLDEIEKELNIKK